MTDIFEEPVDIEQLTDAQLDKLLQEQMADLVDAIIDHEQELRNIITHEDLKQVDRLVDSAKRIRNGTPIKDDVQRKKDAFDYAMEIL